MKSHTCRRSTFTPTRQPGFLIAILIAALLSGGDVAISRAAAQPQPGAQSELPVDPDLEIGTLDNGLRYIIKNHPTPPGRVGLFLNIESGSLNETDDQRGLAHFLEHMAFNGSEHFPPGELIPFFERLGLQFGRHQNAFTSFDRTMYFLDMPKNDPATVEEGMKYLSDVAYRLLLAPEEIDDERGVIMEELRTGLGAQMRITKELWPQIMPGARLPDRFPIGEEEVIQNAPREEFLAYYSTWYRPDLMTFIVVGDIEPDVARPMIEKWFIEEDLDRTQHEARPSGVTPYDHQMAAVVTDPEYAGVAVEAMQINPPRGAVTTIDALRREVVTEIATFALDRRLARMITSGEAPFRAADTQSMRFMHDFSVSWCEAQAEPEEWRESLQRVVQEVARARQHGFLAREIEDAKKQILAGAEQAVKVEDSIPSIAYGQRLAGQAQQGDALISAGQRLDALKMMLPDITPAEVGRIYAADFDPARMAFIVTMEEAGSDLIPTDDEVLAAAREALELEMTPYALEDRPDSILEEAPEAGAVAAKQPADDLGVTIAQLVNNVHFYHKFNDQRKNVVTVLIDVIGGSLLEDESNRGITDAAIAAINQPSTSRLTSSDIRDLMTGQTASLSASAARDSITISVSSAPEDLETGLQLAHALLTDPRVEASAFERWREQQLETIEAEKHDAFAQVRMAYGRAITDDVRRRPLIASDVESLGRVAVEAWLRSMLRERPIEVAVVGDMEFDAVEPLVAKYLGSVGQRPERLEGYERLATLDLNPGPYSRTVEYEAIEPVAFALAGLRGVDESNVRDSRLFNVASMVLSTRMNKTIREERRLVYSIGAFSQPADVYPRTGLFAAASYTAPENSATLADLILEMMGEFAAEGPTADEIEVAVGQIVTQLETDRKEPDYWLSALAKLTTREKSLDDLRNELAFYRAVNAEDVASTFREYFTPDAAIRIVVNPTTPDMTTENP